ncbi:hypothetical protein SNARM312S_00136 [Streptomyces narbonensis]
MDRLRRATTRAASSRLSAPATYAAAISPCECPMTACGVTPWCCQSLASETMTAKVTGCTTSTRSSVGAPGVCRTTASSDQSTYGASAASHSAIVSANSFDVSRSSAPIPAHCVPWPGKTNATRPTSVDVPRISPSGAVSACAKSPVPVPIATARCSNCARPSASTRATAPASTSSVPPCEAYAARRPIWASSAAGDFAETSHGTRPPADGSTAGVSFVRVSSAGVSTTPGASSRTTCAFVPLTPKEETAARRSPPSPLSGQSMASVSSSTAPAAQSTWSVGRSTWSVFGRTPWRIAWTILMTPETPAAAWVWPMLDFNEPSRSGCSASRPCPYVAMTACASMGSPSRVPVPCASTTSTSAVVSRASARARRITRC